MNTNLVLYPFDPVNLSDEYTTILTFQDPIQFSQIVMTLYNQELNPSFQEEMNHFTFSFFRAEKELKIGKDTLFISDILRFDADNVSLRKQLVNYLVSTLNEQTKEALVNETQRILSLLLPSIDLIDLPIDFSQDFSYLDYMKLPDFHISTNECQSIYDKIVLLLNVESELNTGCILILANITNYLSAAQVLEICHYAAMIKQQLLLIEHSETIKEASSEYAKYHYFDSDFVQFNL